MRMPSTVRMPSIMPSTPKCALGKVSVLLRTGDGLAMACFCNDAQFDPLELGTGLCTAEEMAFKECMV